jgi:alginate O-acetyltransferase complex protein AlgI
MSYVFDIYRGLRKPVTNMVDYAVFVSFFPLLIAGPIERANHLLPQVQAKRSFNYAQAVSGGRLILWGMFKKVVIADSLALYVNDIFDRYPSHHSLTLILGAVGFSFQIYADFSGYTDIATGTAKLFGFELLSNFRFPYFSRDLAEFWRRWHISLTTWFRDYLYIPLGGSKQGKWLSVRNTFIVFLVSGLWHGASWNFIVWGGIHACGFLPLLLSSRNRRHAGAIVAADRLLPSARELLQMLGTFAFVTISWIFFRLHGVRNGVGYIKGIFSSFEDPGEVFRFLGILYYVLPLIMIDWWLRRDERKIRWVSSPAVGWAIYVIALTLIFAYMGNSQAYRFIYFQF